MIKELTIFFLFMKSNDGKNVEQTNMFVEEQKVSSKRILTDLNVLEDDLDSVNIIDSIISYVNWGK